MRPLVGVLALLLAASPLALAQGGPIATTITLSGAGPVLDLTENPTRTVSIQVQFTADKGFTCTSAATITVDLNVTTAGPITASIDNKTATYTIPAAQPPLQPYRDDAFTTLTITKTGPHEEAEAVVTATYAGGSVPGCVPSTFAASNASIAVRSTALGGAASPPNVTIASPKAGAEGNEFQMVVAIAEFDLKPVGTTPGKAAGQGHIHYLVDGKPAEGDYATPNKNFTFRNLAAGEHTLRAELVNNDHTPLSPPIFAEVKVKATGAKTTPTSPTTPTGSTPIGAPVGATPTPTPAADDEKSLLPGPHPALVLGLLGAAALVARRRRRA